jgi:hypothetical protein
MTYKKIDIAAFISTTTVFFLLIGGLVGSIFSIPFLETITHKTFRSPSDLALTVLLGYLIVGMPVAGITGFLYGILCLFRGKNEGHACHCLNVSALISGTTLPTIFGMIIAYQERHHGFVESLRPFLYVTTFSVICAVVTAWLHCRASNRFAFFRLKTPLANNE